LEKEIPDDYFFISLSQGYIIDDKTIILQISNACYGSIFQFKLSDSIENPNLKDEYS